MPVDSYRWLPPSLKTYFANMPIPPPDGVPWAERWSGPPFVVYGHTPRPDIFKLKWSVGIDTACVFGGHLTAFILPERRFVQVKARRRYYGDKKG